MTDKSDRTPPHLIRSEADIPDHFDSPEEEAEFWETHGFSREFLRSRRLIPPDQGPVARMKARQAHKSDGSP